MIHELIELAPIIPHEADSLDNHIINHPAFLSSDHSIVNRDLFGTCDNFALYLRLFLDNSVSLENKTFSSV